MTKFNLDWLKCQIEKNATKKVAFGSLSKCEKIAYLETITETTGKKKTFKKSVKVVTLSKDMKMHLISEFAKVGNLDAVAKIANNDQEFTANVNVVLTYDKMSDSQKLDFLRLENRDIEDCTDIEVNIFGGANVVELLTLVRGLSDSDFTNLISK